jgi:tellurite resistance protein TerC
MRAGLILLGSALVERFHLILYLFGAFLIYSAIKLALAKEDDEVDPEHNPVLKLARRALPVAEGDTGKSFFVRQQGALKVPSLFLILIVVETTDLILALDSIPAVIGITKDPFIVYTSNVCAILGLRSLFFVVASLMDKFHYLKVGLSVILGFVGLKMIVETFMHLGPDSKKYVIMGSLTFIALTLAISIVASILRPPKSSPAALAAEKDAGLEKTG